MVDLFNISIIDLTPAIIRMQLQQETLQTRGIRAADALHMVTAIWFDADLVISTDDALLQLDGSTRNSRGDAIACQDTDVALSLL